MKLRASYLNVSMKLTNFQSDSSRKTVSPNLKNKRGEITTNTTEIQKFNEYYESYANKLDNIVKMDKFLETCNF